VTEAGKLLIVGAGHGSHRPGYTCLECERQKERLMTDPIDLLDEASWLDGDAPTAVEEDRPVALAVDFSRTVGDLRHLIALAQDAEQLRAAVTAIEAEAVANRDAEADAILDQPDIQAAMKAYFAKKDAKLVAEAVAAERARIVGDLRRLLALRIIKGETP